MEPEPAASTDPIWVVRRNGAVTKRFEVQFPEITAPKPFPRYLALGANQQVEYLRASMRRGASRYELWVSPRAFPRLADPLGMPATFHTISAFKFHCHKVLRDPGQGLTLMGLVIALVGLLIQASLGIGKIAPIWIVSDTVLVWSTVMVFVLQTGGLCLVFIKGILERDV